MVRACTFKFYKCFLATIFIFAIVVNVVSLTVKMIMTTVKERLEFDSERLSEIVESKKSDITHHATAFILYYIGFLICILESYRWIVTYVIAQALAAAWFSIVHSNNAYTVHISSLALVYIIFAFCIPASDVEDEFNVTAAQSITFSHLTSKWKTWQSFLRKNKRLLSLVVSFLLMILLCTFCALFILEIHYVDKREVTLTSFQHSLELDVKRGFFALPLAIVITLCTIPITSCGAKIHRMYYPMQVISSLLFWLVAANSPYFEFIGAISILTLVSAFFARIVRENSASLTLRSSRFRDFDLGEDGPAIDSLIKS